MSVAYGSKSSHQLVRALILLSVISVSVPLKHCCAQCYCEKALDSHAKLFRTVVLHFFFLQSTKGRREKVVLIVDPVWCCILFILALGRQRQIYLWVPNRPGLLIKFRASQGYIVRRFKNKQKTLQIMWLSHEWSMPLIPGLRWLYQNCPKFYGSLSYMKSYLIKIQDTGTKQN